MKKTANRGAGGVMNRRSQGQIIAILALVVVVVLVASYGILQIMERRTHSAAEKLVSDVVGHIDGMTGEVEAVTREAARTAAAMLDDPDALEQLTRDFVSENSYVYGSTVAFEPDAFPDRGRCFAPYSWDTGDGVIRSRQLGTETDYYGEEWYAETKRTDAEYWCEPYFDEGGAKIMMCTFTVPLRDAEGHFRAAMTADVGLADLEQYITSISPYPDSYIVLRSGKGNALANADRSAAPGSGATFLKGITGLGWSVELMIPFRYLMHGDTGVYFVIGTILLLTVAFVYCINRLMFSIRQRESAGYIRVIDAISRAYTSIHLVDLETQETVVYRDPENYAQVIGEYGRDGTVFTEKMARLIGYDCCPADRDLMTREVDPETIRSRLAGQDRYEVRFRKDTDGNIRWYEMHVFVMERNADGAPVSAVVAFADVNDSVLKEKETQETLEQALAMAESANRAKTTFLNSMSHDIRTPMNAIIGFTGLAASHIDNKEQVQDYLGKIAQSSDHLLSLINDVLDMSRIESGKMHLNEKPENLSEIMHMLRDIVQSDIRAKRIDFCVDAVDVKDEGVVCDRLRLNQVLLNILSNAIKYTPAGGNVSLRIAETAVKENGRASYTFRVKDNGIGMSKEFLTRIFDPFTRVQSSTVSGIQGTGLGMAITRSIVDMMGGTIGVESEPGKGTEVTVTFDFQLSDGAVRTAEIAEYRGTRALVVDDDASTCLSVSDMLRDIGMRQEWCTSGKEAVIRADEAHRIGDPFGVYIIDCLMPDMNGIETTRRIRRIVGDDASVIILTAYDWSDLSEEAKEAGVTAFVSKPMFPSDLTRVLNDCVGRRDEAEELEERGSDPRFAAKRILLTEDNELNREIATEILEELGFVIDTAEDGHIAVEKMRLAKPGDYDLVLMDIQMPVMDGYEATRRIRALGTEISRIPIVAMTANAFEEDRKAALDAGMNEHIAKPIDVDKLKGVLTEFLS